MGRLGRSFLKRFMYSQFSVLSGIKIALGMEHPLLPFTVEADPPSIYWVFRIKTSEMAGLEKILRLPAPFSLCPVRCLEEDEPAYLMVVNAYRVSGLANAVRAEWSVFVRDHDGTPRYMVIDARSSKRSVDPVDVITPASTVIHQKNGHTIETRVGDGEQEYLSTITLPADPPLARTSAEFVTANDYIYWRNGIRDRTFYNASLANARQLYIGNEQCSIRDGSVWSQFIESEPVHTFVLDGAIEFIISPWENVDSVHKR